MVRYSEIGNKSDSLPLVTKWPFELIYFSKRKTFLKAFPFQGPISSTETISFLINEFRKIELGKPALFLFLGELVHKKKKHSDLLLCALNFTGPGSPAEVEGGSTVVRCQLCEHICLIPSSTWRRPPHQLSLFPLKGWWAFINTLINKSE